MAKRSFSIALPALIIVSAGCGPKAEPSPAVQRQTDMQNSLRKAYQDSQKLPPDQRNAFMQGRVGKAGVTGAKPKLDGPEVAK